MKKVIMIIMCLILLIQQTDLAGALTGEVTVTLFSTEFIYGGEPEEASCYVWTPNSDSSGHRFSFRISYSFSGIGEIEENEVIFRIPASILRLRDGSSGDELDMAIPHQSELENISDENISFAWYQDGDTVVIYNFHQLSAAENGYIELSYVTTASTMQYPDMGENQPFSCSLAFRNTTLNADPVRVLINTSATLSNVRKEAPRHMFSQWNEAWGSEPDDSDQYDYLIWGITSYVSDNITQPYDLKIHDFPGNTEVEIVGYRFAGSQGYSRENEVHDQTMTGVRYDSVLTRLPRDLLADQTHWETLNRVEIELTGSDHVDESQLLKSQAVFYWNKPVFQLYPGSLTANIRADGIYRAKQYSYLTYLGMKNGQYSRYDLETLSDGEVTFLDDLDYAVWIFGNSYYWTKGDGLDPDDPDSYGKKKVRYELLNEEFYLFDEADGVDNGILLTDGDYQIDFINCGYFIRDAVLDAQTMELNGGVPVYDSGDIVTFHGRQGGSWHIIARYHLKEGYWEPVNVKRIEKNKLYLDSGYTGYRVEYDSNHYLTNIDTVCSISLLNSPKVMNFIENRNFIGIRDRIQGQFSQDGELIGLATDEECNYLRKSERTSAFSKKVVSSANDPLNKSYRITWKIDVAEEIRTADEECDYVEQPWGVFYDLLPQGCNVDVDSIILETEKGPVDSSRYAVHLKENFRNSGRTMMTVKVSQPADWYHLFYDTVHSWDSITDYGNEVCNPVAYRSGNARISQGYCDDGGTLIQKELMADLDDSVDTTCFIYAEGFHDISAITAASAGLTKKVRSSYEHLYSYNTTVANNTSYVYQLRYQNSSISKARDLVLYDALENYSNISEWHGILEAIDVSQPISRGAEPVIYLSAERGIDFTGEIDLNSGSWKKMSEFGDISRAAAIAVDMRRTADDGDFILNEGESIAVYLYMRSPSAVENNGNGYPETFNNVYLFNTVIDSMNNSESFLIHHDYTTVRYRIEGDLEIHKVNEEHPEQGIEGVTFRLSGISDYGTVINTMLKSDRDGNVIFRNVEKGSYLLQETDCGNDWVLDTEEYHVTVDGQGRTFINGTDHSTEPLIITNRPRIYGDLLIEKRREGTGRELKTLIETVSENEVNSTVHYQDRIWIVRKKTADRAQLVSQDSGEEMMWIDLSVPAEIRIPDVTFLLEGVSDYGKSVSLLRTTDTVGRLSFENLDQGIYTLREVSGNENYLLNHTSWNFRIDETGEARLIGYGQKDRLWETERNGRYYIIYDEPAAFSFELKKVDEENDTICLSGAEYGLYDNSGLVTTAVSGADGSLVFTGVPRGTYFLKEITAPVRGNIHYLLDNDTIILTVDERGTVHMEDERFDDYGNLLVSDRKAYDRTIVITKKWHDGSDNEHRPTPVVHLVTQNPFNKLDNIVSEEPARIRKIPMSVPSVNIRLLEDDNAAIVDSGTDGTCSWTLYDNGLLSFTSGRLSTVHQWQQYNGQVTAVRFNGLLTLPNTVAGLFEGFSSLVTCQFEQVDCSELRNMDRMFRNCSSLISLDMSMFTESSLTSMLSVFTGCSALQSIDIGNLDVSEVTTMNSLFSKSGIVSLDLSGWNTSSLTNMQSMFQDCSSLTELKQNFNTSNVTSMSYTFRGCSALQSLDLQNFDTSRVRNLSYMFYGCSVMNSLLLGEFGNDVCTNFSFMFYGCRKLASLDLSGFQTPAATNMASMFYSCGSLTELDLSSFDTSEVTSFSSMFASCTSLEKIILSSFDTSSVKVMNKMFYQCRKLRKIDLSSFTYDQVTNMTDMFSSTNALGKLVIGYDMSPLFANVRLSGNWIRKYDGNGTRIYDSPQVTSAELMAMSPDDLAGTWVRPDYAEYVVRPDGAYEYVSEDRCWVKNGDVWTYVFDVLDDSIDYWMYEESLDGYISSVMYPDYQIIKGNAGIDNYADTGNLTIRKTVENGSTDRKFHFEIELEGISGNVLYDGILFREGKAEIALADGEAKTIRFIPKGIRYSIRELDSEGYEVISENAGGVISDDSEVSFINKPVTAQTHQKVTIRKTVTGRWESDDAYEFTVYLDNLITNHGYGSAVSDDQGRCCLTVYLRDGEEYVIDDLPVNSRIQVNEAAGNYVSSFLIYDVNGNDMIAEATGKNQRTDEPLQTGMEVLDAGEQLVMVFTNEVMIRHELTVVKHTSSQDSFDFTLNLNGLIPNENYLSSAGVIKADEYGNAKKSFTLADAEEFRVSGLPSQTGYQVEEDPGSYETSYVIMRDGVIVLNSDASRITQTRTLYGGDERVEYTNLVTEKWLTVRKNVEGNLADRTRKFSFGLRVSKNGQQVNSIDVKVSEREFSMLTGLQGYFEFELGHGDEMSFAIPVDGDIEVFETDCPDYLTHVMIDEVIQQASSCTVHMDEDREVVFVNKRDIPVPTGLSVSKTDKMISVLPGLGLLVMLILRRHR